MVQHGLSSTFYGTGTWPTLSRCNAIETSTNLVDWIYLGSIYRELNAGPLFFEDPDAWKYGQRFYRIPQYQGSGN